MYAYILFYFADNESYKFLNDGKTIDPNQVKAMVERQKVLYDENHLSLRGSMPLKIVWDMSYPGVYKHITGDKFLDKKYDFLTTAKAIGESFAKNIQTQAEDAIVEKMEERFKTDESGKFQDDEVRERMEQYLVSIEDKVRKEANKAFAEINKETIEKAVHNIGNKIKQSGEMLDKTDEEIKEAALTKVKNGFYNKTRHDVSKRDDKIVFDTMVEEEKGRYKKEPLELEIIVDGHGFADLEIPYIINNSPQNPKSVSYYVLSRICLETASSLKAKGFKITTDITFAVCHASANEPIKPSSTIIPATVNKTIMVVDEASKQGVRKGIHNTTEVKPFTKNTYKQWINRVGEENALEGEKEEKTDNKVDNIITREPEDTKDAAFIEFHNNYFKRARPVYTKAGATGLFVDLLGIQDQTVALRSVKGGNHAVTSDSILGISIALDKDMVVAIDDTPHGQNSRIILYEKDPVLEDVEDLMGDVLDNISQLSDDFTTEGKSNKIGKSNSDKAPNISTNER
jgi:hypothetical protein